MAECFVHVVIDFAAAMLDVQKDVTTYLIYLNCHESTFYLVVATRSCGCVMSVSSRDLLHGLSSPNCNFKVIM